jgi:Uma2 family endonuclease
MVATARIPMLMTVPEFLAWNPDGGARWQLVDGEPLAMAPANRTHASLQSELSRVIGNHLQASGSPCVALVEAGVVPNVRARHNFRVPDLAVTCSPYTEEEASLTDPVLLVEILSPSNQAETWGNVWTYTTIPSVQEILVLHTVRIAAEVLRRRADGSWPEEPELAETGDLTLGSIGFAVPLAALYRTTRLARR